MHITFEFVNLYRLNVKLLFMTDHIDFKQMAERYRKELYDSVLPFWLEHSQDKEYGGYFTCLNPGISPA